MGLEFGYEFWDFRIVLMVMGMGMGMMGVLLIRSINVAKLHFF